MLEKQVKINQNRMCAKMGKSGRLVREGGQSKAETAMVLKALFRMMIHVILILRAVEKTQVAIKLHNELNKILPDK